MLLPCSLDLFFGLKPRDLNRSGDYQESVLDTGSARDIKYYFGERKVLVQEGINEARKNKCCTS